jgi:protein-L-isoaspartate O-methyltransferase
MIRTFRLGTLLLAGASLWAQKPEFTPNHLAPYVPSPYQVVDRMLELARIKPSEKVFDLGSGDGRVVITAAQKYDARATGIEISSRLVKSSQEEVKRLGLQNKVSIVHGDVFEADLREADVVILYLLRDSNNTLKPKLEKSLKAGARVISHDYEIEGWKPQLEEKIDAHRRGHRIFVYKMPPQK